MKHLIRLLSLAIVSTVVITICLNAGDKKDKVALTHNGRVIVVAREAVPAHLAHGDALVTNYIQLTLIYDVSTMTVDGSGLVPQGGSATFTVTTVTGGSIDVTVDGSPAGTYSSGIPFDLGPFTETHTITFVLTPSGGVE